MSEARFVVRAIVTDIEGTTSAISFVKDVLFPYAEAHLEAFVAEHRGDAEVRAWLRDAAAEAGEPDADEARVVAILRGWMAEDRKATPLKAIQGRIWEAGYASTGLRGHLYDDVAPVLRRWRDDGLSLYVYSSGSVPAQKTLFAHTPDGDLTPLFAGFFDTSVGAKVERASYERIAAAIGGDPQTLLFLSDNERELDAARDAGWRTARFVRPADTPAGATTSHPAYVSFSRLADDVVPAPAYRSSPQPQR